MFIGGTILMLAAKSALGADNIGVFVDARWVVPDKTKNYGVGRLGLRLAF